MAYINISDINYFFLSRMKVMSITLALVKIDYHIPVARKF